MFGVKYDVEVGLMDEDILNLLAHFREQLQTLTADFQRIKDAVFALYKENEELTDENQNLKNLLFEKELKGKEHAQKTGAAYANLARLYDEGFHICHLNFAEKRRGDCLFCQKFLEGPDSRQHE